MPEETTREVGCYLLLGEWIFDGVHSIKARRKRATQNLLVLSIYSIARYVAGMSKGQHLALRNHFFNIVLKNTEFIQNYRRDRVLPGNQLGNFARRAA